MVAVGFQRGACNTGLHTSGQDTDRLCHCTAVPGHHDHIEASPAHYVCQGQPCGGTLILCSVNNSTYLFVVFTMTSSTICHRIW